jgi:hypothetical protein
MPGVTDKAIVRNTPEISAGINAHAQRMFVCLPMRWLIQPFHFYHGKDLMIDA